MAGSATLIAVESTVTTVVPRMHATRTIRFPATSPATALIPRSSHFGCSGPPGSGQGWAREHAREGDPMRQLTSLDAQFLAVESARTYGHVGGLAVYDPATAPGGDLTVKDICRLVGERIHLLPPFRWRLVGVPLGLDHPYWVEDPDFDLDFHIRESAVPPPGDDRRLAETVARIFARPLDRTRPLWELYLIQGLEGGRVALLTKLHHSMVDGVSGNEILGVLLDPSREGREIPPAPEGKRGERVPGDLEMLGRGLLGLPRQPVRALRSLPTALPNLTELPGANAFPVVPQVNRALSRLKGGGEDPGLLEVTTARAPKTSFNGPVS